MTTAETLALHPRWEFRRWMPVSWQGERYIVVGAYDRGRSLSIVRRTNPNQYFNIVRVLEADSATYRQVFQEEEPGMLTPDMDSEEMSGILFGLLTERAVQLQLPRVVLHVLPDGKNIAVRVSATEHTYGNGSTFAEAAGRCLLACWVLDESTLTNPWPIVRRGRFAKLDL